MSQALYRKYRPQTFAEVFGQEITKQILQNEIASGDLSHAYLFSGPRGTGKTSLARIFAKALNCLNRTSGESEPCNACDLCKEITLGVNLDIFEIDAASHTGVDNVRENIIENARFIPQRGKYKLFIIDEVHMLSRGAFNALLKILEEPPAQVMFILATTELHKVPETVASRCQRFSFRNVDVSLIKDRLKLLSEKENLKISEETLNDIARAAQGSLRDAESVLGQVASLQDDSGAINPELARLILPKSDIEETRKFYEFLSAGEAGQIINLLYTLSNNGVNLEKFYDSCLEFGRELMLDQIGAETDKAASLGNLAQRFHRDKLIKFLENLMSKKELIRYSPIPQLPLELAVIDFCATLRQPASKALPETSQTILQQKNEKQEKSAATENNITLDHIKLNWNTFLDRLVSENHSLQLLLRLSEPVEFSGNLVKIAVQYRFHKEQLNETKTRFAVEKILSEVFKTPLRAETLTKPLPQNVPDGIMLQNVLREFGGQVVE